MSVCNLMQQQTCTDSSSKAGTVHRASRARAWMTWEPRKYQRQTHTHTHRETCTYTEAMQGKAKQSHNQRPDSNSPGGKATNRREPHIDRERPMQQQHTRRRRRNLTRRALECGPTTSQIQNKPTGVELELLVFWLEPSWVGFRLEFQCCKWR